MSIVVNVHNPGIGQFYVILTYSLQYVLNILPSITLNELNEVQQPGMGCCYKMLTYILYAILKL